MAKNVDEKLEELSKSGVAGTAKDEGTASAQDDVDSSADFDREAADLSAAVAEDYAHHSDFEDASFDEAGVPRSRLLSFYDRLRERVMKAVEERGGKLGPAAVRALLVVPDVFILMVRLTMDREVPSSARAMIGGALAYFILPVDLLPEAVMGAGGYLDDLVLASAVLAHTFSGDLEPYARKHWSGKEDLRKVLGDVADAAQGLLGQNMYDRVKKLLDKKGIEVKE